MMAKSRKEAEKVVKKKTKKVSEKKAKGTQANNLPNEVIKTNIDHPNVVEGLKEETVDNHTDEKQNKIKKTGKVNTKKTRQSTGKKVKTSTKNTAEIGVPAEKSNITQTDDQAGDAIGAVNASTENEVFADKVGAIQTDGQADSESEVVDEDHDAIVSFKEEKGNLQADDQAGSATEEAIGGPDSIVSLAEKEEDPQAGDQTGSATEEVIGGPDSIVNIIETEGEAQADGQTSSEVGAADEDPDEIVSFTETEEDVLADSQTISFVESAIEDSDAIVSYPEKEEDPQTDKPKDGEPEDVVIGIANIESHTDNTDDGQMDAQADDSATILENEEDKVGGLSEDEGGIQVDEEDETNFEDAVEEIQMDDSHYDPPTRTKKMGNFLPVILMVAAVVLLLVGSMERRSAKKALVEANKVADVIRQMLEESVKGKEQIIHSQIEGRELVIDALLLTRNGFELELTNTDEKEVKKIIGVFINNIDERAKKIKSEITALRNKLKMNN